MRFTLKLLALLQACVLLFIGSLLHAQSVTSETTQDFSATQKEQAILDVLESAVEDFGFLLTLHDKVTGNTRLLDQLNDDYRPLFDQDLIAKLALQSNLGTESEDRLQHLACLVNLAIFNKHLKLVADNLDVQKSFQITSTESSTGNPNVATVQLTLHQAEQPFHITYRLYYQEREALWRIWNVNVGSSSLLSVIRSRLKEIRSSTINADRYNHAKAFLTDLSAEHPMTPDQWCPAAPETPTSPDATEEPDQTTGFSSFAVKTSFNEQPHTVFLEVDSNDTVLYQDDIILDTEGDLQAAISGLDFRRLRLWPNATVPYIIDASIADKALILKAIDEWETNTPVKFIKAKDTDTNFVVFTAGEGCRAWIGMKRQGRQDIVLGHRCSYGTILHEIGHTLGLIHEHNRVDRDNFIDVKLKNVQHQKEHNFRKHPPGHPVVDAYCYDSIMHYSEHAFAISRGLKTIVATNYRVGQRQSLSACDLRRVRQLYTPLARKSEAPDNTKP
jgi:predicted Zn-dependent protease